MRRSVPTVFTTTVLAVVAGTAPTWAQETGLHTLHTIARSGSSVCMTDHEHYGESPASSTQGVAKKLALNKWVSFTAEEYGKIWGNYALAAGKREACTGTAPNIVCSVTARPCRPAR
jgi:hypothetical protein